MSTAQGERRLRLAATRSLLYSLPANELFELPGRPHVVYQLRTYANTGNVEEAALAARNDSPFLFKAFETGQIGPKRLARMHGERPRVATIHEYLDWTVTAQAAEGDEDLDFDGFRVLVILPRYRSAWPPPSGDVCAMEEPRKQQHLIGAPKGPLPMLQTHGKPVTAATIRSGPGYLEIPFVATHENKRGRGYCRCLVEAIEEIARALGLKKLMLCSTNDASVQSTWQHLGFEYASDEQMEEWDILHTDLVYLQNTTQMHKDVPPPRRVKPVVIKHEVFRQRSYAFIGQKRPQRPGGSALPAASRPRLSSRRSESTSRDASQSVAARDPRMPSHSGVGAACSGGQPLQGEVSPLGAAQKRVVTPQAAVSVSGRQPGSRLADDEADLQGQLSAGQSHAETRPGSGPPTPQPADGGHARPAHAHATIDAPSTSQTDLAGRPDGVCGEEQALGSSAAARDGCIAEAGQRQLPAPCSGDPAGGQMPGLPAGGLLPSFNAAVLAGEGSLGLASGGQPCAGTSVPGEGGPSMAQQGLPSEPVGGAAGEAQQQGGEAPGQVQATAGDLGAAG